MERYERPDRPARPTTRSATPPSSTRTGGPNQIFVDAPRPEPAQSYYDEFDDPDFGFPGEPPPSRGTRRHSGGGSGGGKPRRRSVVWRMRRVLFVLGLTVMALIAAAVAMIADTELPDPQDLQQSSFVCAADVPENCDSNNALAKLSAAEDRENISLDQVPKVVIQAVVDSEDRYFFEHKGIDPLSISRALYWDVRSGTAVQGGSTITQQYVKNTFLTHDQTLRRKLNEAILSIKVEQTMSKEQILEGYLNTIFFGRNVYGIRAASRAYFGKDVKDLKLPEASYLAGLIRAPNLADATANPEAAKDRRRKVLVSMLEAGHITQQQYDETDKLPFDYVKPPARLRTLKLADKGGGYITEYVSQALKKNPEKYGLTADDVGLGGLRVYTSIDPAMQTAAWDAMYNPAVNNYHLNDPALPLGAMVSIDNNGQIKAMVGGRGDGQGANFAVFGFGSEGRPVGSTFKPIVLAEAIHEGFSLDSMLPAPKQTEIPSIPNCDVWKPRNAGESEYPGERINLVTATQASVNTAYAHLIYELAKSNGNSTDKVRQMAKNLGMDNTEINECLTMVLGANNSTPLEMAEVYSTFANGGVHKEPKLIVRVEQVDQKGNVNVVYQAQDENQRVLTEREAAKITNTLEKVIADGTGTRAKISRPAAGKTGTTADNKDAWFVGYTPKLTTAVWMGFEKSDGWVNPDCIEDATNGVDEGNYADYAGHPEKCPQELPKMGSSGGRPVYDWPQVTGGSIPAIIWQKYMEQATANTNDPFLQLSPDEYLDGNPLEIEGFPTGTTIPPTSIPGFPPDTVPGGGGRPGRPPTTFTIPTLPTTTSIPDETTTTSSSIPLPPGGGGPGGTRP